MEEHKDDLDSILNKIIEDRFKAIMGFFEKNGISTDKKPKLKIIESPYIGIYELIKSYINDSPIPSIAELALTLWMMWKYRRISGLYAQPSGTVYIIKKPLKRNIKRLFNYFYKHRKTTDGYSIEGIVLSEFSNMIWPAYINWNDIKNSVAKIPVDIVIGHELSHFFISTSELVASTFDYLTYFYENEFHKYHEAHKIINSFIKENIKQCKEYIEKEEKPLPFELGRCYANIIIDKNKESEEINMEDIIKKNIYLSEEDVINEIKSYKIQLKYKI